MGLVLALPGCKVVTQPDPFAPSDLAAAVISSSEIDLTWKDNSPDEAGFYIYRKSTDNYSRVAVIEANTTFYKDTKLSPETSYSYKVTAFNEGGESGSSNEATVTTTPPDAEILDYHIEERDMGFSFEAWETKIVGQVRNNTYGNHTLCVGGRFFDYNCVSVGVEYVLVYVYAGGTEQFEIKNWVGTRPWGPRIKRVEVWVGDVW